MQKRGENMTLDEAIRHAEEVAEYDCYNDDQRKCSDEHRQLAEWLRELKRLRESATDTDTISRQAAIDEIKTCRFVVDAIEKIRGLPSAQPERKMGKWIYNSPVTMKCDQCGFVIKDWDWHRFKFCPNCDCDMRGEQE